MVAKTLDQPFDRALRRSGFEPFAVVAVAVVFSTTIVRFTFGVDQPLWLDETFTGAFATLPSIDEVLRQSLLDVNAPLYYVLAHAWSSVFGASNQALRAPAVVFGCISPLLCLIPARGLPRTTSLLWCILIALWAPGFFYAQEARCYTLLLCLSILATIAFARLLERPDLRRGAVWSLLGCLAILTHYYALILIGCQFLAYLALQRTRALRTWPAALLFAPALLWLALHFPRIAAFAAPDIAWYRQPSFIGLLPILNFATGSLIVFVLLPAFGLVVWIKSLMGRGGRDSVVIAAAATISDHLSASESAWVAAACAYVGAGFVIILAFARPTFTQRYLIPFVPGILLGIALCGDRLKIVWRLTPSVLLLLYAFSSLNALAAAPPARKVYNFEAASDRLIAAKTHKLVFFWDHPATVIEDPSQLSLVGGFFFKRRGVDVTVTPFRVARHEDPNTPLEALARRSGASILWVYDTSVHDTAASQFPPRIALSRDWSCHDFGSEPTGILACNPVYSR